MKQMTISRVKTWEDESHIGFNEYTFWGFMGHKKGFTNKWFQCFIPFSDGRVAWHFLGFRFTKSPSYVDKRYQQIGGWWTSDKALVEKLRNL